MANTIEAAELIEAEIAKLKELLTAHKKLARTLGDDSMDALIFGTKQIIKTNEETVKIIRESLSE